MSFCQMLPVRVAVSAGTYSAGTWSSVAGFEKLDLDLNTLATVPTGATCAIFHVNTNSTGARFGIQDSNGADEFAVSATAVTGRQDFAMLIPINGTQTVDIFVTNTTNAVVYLMGYMSHPTFITPVGVSGGITSATVTTIDLGTTDIVPVGAANGSVIVTVDKLCKMAGTSAALATMLKPAANVVKAYAIVPLDADRKFYVQSYASFAGADALRVVAWMTPKGYVHEVTYTSEQVAAVNTWTPASKISTGSYDHWRLNTGTTSVSGSGTPIGAMRPSGDTNYTTAIDGDTTVNNPYRFVIPNGSGEVDIFNAVTKAVKFERHGSFPVDTTAPAILSIDTFVEGATATITLDASVVSFTSLAIKGTDGHILTVASFSGSGDTWTFTVPPIADEEEGVRTGTVLITPTTSGGVGEEYATTYTKTDYVLVELEDVLTPNLGTVVGATPAFKSQDIGVSLGTQVAYNPAEVTIDVHGGLDWAVDGVHDIYYYDPDDFTWRQITITTEVGGDVDDEPDALIFASATNTELLSEHTSTTETVTGMSAGESSAFTVANGTYSKNGGSFISTAGTMENGDTFALRGTSDQYFGRSKDVTLTAANGSVVSTYRITNKLDPLLPTGGGSTVVGQFLTGYTL